MKSKWLVQLLFIYLCMYLLSIVCMYTVNICIIQPSIVAVFAVRCSLIPNRNVSIVIILYRSTCAFHKKFLMCNTRTLARTLRTIRKKKKSLKFHFRFHLIWCVFCWPMPTIKYLSSIHINQNLSWSVRKSICCFITIHTDQRISAFQLLHFNRWEQWCKQQIPNKRT